jgi:Regulator of chromosome condensation (RCC1) repeat
MQSSEMPGPEFHDFSYVGKFFPTLAGKSWRRMVKGNKHMKTKTKSARLSMKTKTNPLLGAVIFLLVIGATALVPPVALAQAANTVVAWGTNSDGQLSVPKPNSGFVAVAAGYTFSLGLKADGSIKAWGQNISVRPMCLRRTAGLWRSPRASMGTPWA